MNTEITNAVNAANDRAQYDERAKRLLGHKSILAHILVDTVEEFKGMNPKEVVKYIEGEPMIGVVPTEPGLTNVNGYGTQSEKLNIIEKEYDIPLEEDLRKDVSVMCNLSQGIVDDTKAEIIMNMYKKGYTLEQIADVTEKSISEIEEIVKKEPATA